MNVCVVALGKIGLPLAVQFARSGHVVRGADVDDAVVRLINDGRAPFRGEADLDEHLAAMVAAHRVTATTNTTEAVSLSEVVVVVVPLIVDDQKNPDFRALDAATDAIAAGLKPGTLVVYETTLPVSTTRSRFAPRLAERSNLVIGTNLFVAFSPERVYSGRVFADLRKYPKLVGGVDEASTTRAIEFYESALQFDLREDLARPNGVWDLGSAEAAELAKLAETTYRDINIAFANELAVFAERSGIDIHRVIAASNSQPFSHIHQPGVAVGGHCIPVYPHFFLMNAPDALVPAAARAANDRMPELVVERLSTMMGDSLDGRTVVVLGACYRGGVKETAFSGAFGLASALGARRARVLVHDPLLNDDELAVLGFAPYHLGSQCDAAIVQTDHREYQRLTPSDLPGVRILIDGRAVIDRDLWRDVALVGLGDGRLAP